MTDIEIDLALALAIGWGKYDVCDSVLTGNVLVFWREAGCMSKWIPFSHKDWSVIGPIAERYDCFPERVTDNYWFSSLGAHLGLRDSYADTPQKAIAMAVIQGAKK